ncbi:hypothetical protein pEaSNUABM8_00214 [Erwinia phage pEa_SNUABM_8]|nr:hypothetical protein pEaSNUABM8_00214 [Erwinia phage pEa_SNUABM_8]QVW54966.1 hypothetical protein pEaSNUABM4_00213 [Erwinia phage pEa_SNUABM_4]
MSQCDHFLLNAIRSLDNFERYRAGMFIHIGCPKELFDKFMDHPEIGTYFRRSFPTGLKMLADWDSKPLTDERDRRLDPYKVLNDNYLAQRVIMYYVDKGNICAEWMDWENDTRHVYTIEPADKYQAPGMPGAIMDFDNPKSIYLDSLFLDGIAPLYNHDLCIWLAEQMLEEMKTDKARKQGEGIRTLSELKAENDLKTDREKEMADHLRTMAGIKNQ